MPRDSVVSPLTPGAARRSSYCWPPIGLASSAAVPNGGARAQMRPGNTNGAGYWAPATTGVPPAPRGMMFYAGRAAWAMTSNGTGNSGENAVPSFAGINRPLIMPYQEVRGPADLSTSYDFHVWSWSVILAFDQVPGPIVGDLGIVVGCGGRGLVRFGAAHAGMEIGPTDVDTVGVICRQADGGATTFSQNLSGPIDITAFHLYEIRIIGSTATAEARVKFMIDGAVGIELPYGAGTVLPSQSMGAGSIGMNPNILNWRAHATGTVRMYIGANGGSVKSAPTEAALL